MAGRRTSFLVLVVGACAFAGIGLVGCGGGEDRVALAITDTSWTPDGKLVVRTECADLTDDVLLTPSPDGPPAVTIWGSPKVGTCQPQVILAVEPGTTKVIDAATSQVVDLHPAP